MDLEWNLHVYQFAPIGDELTTAKTYPIMTASKGTWVHAVFLHPGVAFDGTSTFTIGDDDSAVGYVNVGAGFGDGFYVCQGPYLQESAAGRMVANIGVVYGTSDPTSTAQDAINLYWNGTNSTEGSMTIYIVYCQLLGDTGIIA